MKEAAVYRSIEQLIGRLKAEKSILQDYFDYDIVLINYF